MKKVVLLALLALALPTVALADTVTDYAGYGTSGAGTATLSGSATNGGSLSFSMVLDQINGGATGNYGTIAFTTGTLSGSGGVFSFTGGTLTITGTSSNTLFSGTFTSGTVIATSTNILVSGALANGGGTATITIAKNGGLTVSSDIGIVSTPEPGTLGLLGTGLVGIAGIVRRKLRG